MEVGTDLPCAPRQTPTQMPLTPAGSKAKPVPHILTVSYRISPAAPPGCWHSDLSSYSPVSLAWGLPAWLQVLHLTHMLTQSRAHTHASAGLGQESVQISSWFASSHPLLSPSTLFFHTCSSQIYFVPSLFPPLAFPLNIP